MSIPTDNEDQLSRGDIWEKARHATIKQLSILNTLRYSEAEFMDDLSALGLNIKNWRQLHALDKIREHLKAADELCDYLNLRRPQIRRSLESKIGKVKEVIAEFNARIKAPDEDDVGSRSVGELCEGVARLNNTTSIWALQLDKDRYYLNSAFRSFHLALVFWENETGAGGLTRGFLDINLTEDGGSDRGVELAKCVVDRLEGIKARLPFESAHPEALRPTGVSLSRHYHNQES